LSGLRKANYNYQQQAKQTPYKKKAAQKSQFGFINSAEKK